MASSVTTPATSTPITNDKINEAANTPSFPPISNPTFSIKDLRAVIPPHCFQRSYFISFLYLFVDLAIISILFYFATFIDYVPNPFLRWALWVLYWIPTGCVATGVWVLAHECGHRAFSPSKLLNDTVGLIFHSALLVPYHAWRITHSRHHKNTSHMEKDEVFVPLLKEEAGELTAFGQSPIAIFAKMLMMSLFGWPTYLLTNAQGRKFDQNANHFSPNSPLFSQKQRSQIIISNIGLVISSSILVALGYYYGFTNLFKFYFVPYLIVNFWLVSITELQHTDASIPHFKDGEWTWLKGALCTVDRDYGVLNIIFHHIGDTHVCHHLFPLIPHYHSEEASQAIRKVLGESYRFDSTPFLKALYKTFQDCVYVQERESGVFWYQGPNEFVNDKQEKCKNS